MTQWNPDHWSDHRLMTDAGLIEDLTLKDVMKLDPTTIVPRPKSGRDMADELFKQPGRYLIGRDRLVHTEDGPVTEREYLTRDESGLLQGGMSDPIEGAGVDDPDDALILAHETGDGWKVFDKYELPQDLGWVRVRSTGLSTPELGI